MAGRSGRRPDGVSEATGPKNPWKSGWRLFKKFEKFEKFEKQGRRHMDPREGGGPCDDEAYFLYVE